MAQGNRKRTLQRQIEAVELEVLTVMNQQREELRLESERLERLPNLFKVNSHFNNCKRKL